MLVGYSSSSEEEEDSEEGLKKCDSGKCGEEEDDGCPAKKRTRNEEQFTKARLPLPGCLLTMFPDEVETQTDDSSLHAGRIRSFKHERGNWATHVYLQYHTDEEFMEMLDELLLAARARGVVLTPQEEFHISLSQTVVLRHHWIQPFTKSLRADLAHCQRFVGSAAKLRVYGNAEKTRTFLGMEVCSGHAQLLELVRVVDRTMTEFHLDTFYKEPSFHVSLAWCVGDVMEQMKECIQELQHVVDDREEGPFVLRLEGAELRCKTGNKTFRFPLRQDR